MASNPDMNVRAADWWLRLAFLSCLLPSLAYLINGVRTSDGGLTPLALLLSVPWAIIVSPFIAFPQFAIAILVGSVPSRLAKMLGAIPSALLGLWYAVWAARADLTGSSTAPLALFFFPIMIQWWAWTATLAAVVIAQIWSTKRRRPDR